MLGLFKCAGPSARLWKASDIRPAAPSWPVPLGLPPAFSPERACVDQASRIQHDLGFVRLFITESGRVAQVSRAISGLSTVLTSCRYLLAATQYYHSSSYLQPGNFPSNDTIAGLASGLAEAHRAYGVEGYDFSLRAQKAVVEL